MRDVTDTSIPSRWLGGRFAGALPYVTLAGAVFLAWQIIVQPVVQRAPPSIAVRLAPTSPLVLRRAAEMELAAERTDNAAALGRDALRRSPFDVRALRVVGLTEAQAGRPEQANELLTLAGNWSLRDDPAHAWLVEYRLRRGDYGSAFAHADTLVRRRQDIQPQVFRLFTLSATTDPQRAMPVLANLLAIHPPWRQPYLRGLYETPEGLQVAAGLAVLLQGSSGPLSDVELGDLYAYLAARNPAAVRTLQTRLNRPSTQLLLVNGDIDAEAPRPFQWAFYQEIGAIAEIVDDDLRPGNPALRIEYDGYSGAILAEQLVFLQPGSYRLAAEKRLESGDANGRFRWSMTCLPSGFRSAERPIPDGRGEGWSTSSVQLTVPADCPAQRLRLEGVPAESRSPTVVWFDKVTLARARQEAR